MVAGCSGASATASPTTSAGVLPSRDSRLLASGLAGNLDKLASYRFTEDIYSGAAATSGPSATGAAGSGAIGGTRSLQVEGTVVNDGTRAVQVSMPGVQYVIVGSSAWATSDGTLWASVDNLADVLTLLPTAYYQTWFDPHVSGFSALGDETHNGIDCVHFSGSDSLGNLYASMTGAAFTADLWIARDGGFPVGGRYLIPVGANYSGFSFEITGVNDAANAVAAPTNVVALPS
jgi:hypothetical protein